MRPGKEPSPVAHHAREEMSAGRLKASKSLDRLSAHFRARNVQNDRRHRWNFRVADDTEVSTEC